MPSPDIRLCIAPPWGRRAPPLGLAYLATYLKVVGGLDADAFDFNIALYDAVRDRPELDFWDDPMGIGSARYWEVLNREAPDLVERGIGRLLAGGPRLLAFSVNYHNHELTNGLIRALRARAPELIAVVGGAQTYYLNQLGQLDHAHCAADYAILGEGEIPLLELARRVLDGQPVEEIPGVVPIAAAHRPSRTTSRLHMDLDQIPFPTFEEFALDAYDPGPGQAPHLPMIFTRGCPQSCSFCTDIMIAGGYRNRGVEHTVAEMRHHIARHGIRHYHFLDLQFNSNHKLLRALCERILEERLDVVWSSYGTIHRKIEPELLRLLKAAGCPNMHYGFEHASDRVLKTMNKRYDAALASRNILDAHEAGMGVMVNVIVGYPGETEQDLAILKEFLRRHAHAITAVTNLGTAILQPGSDLDTHGERYGLLKLDGLRRTWCSRDGTNTYEVRLRRAHEIKALLDELGIPVTKFNLEDDLPKFLAGHRLNLDAEQTRVARNLEHRVVERERALLLELRDRRAELTQRESALVELDGERQGLQHALEAQRLRAEEARHELGLAQAELDGERDRLVAQVSAQGTEIARLAAAISRLECERDGLDGQLRWIRSWKGWLCESPLVPRRWVAAALRLLRRGGGPTEQGAAPPA